MHICRSSLLLWLATAPLGGSVEIQDFPHGIFTPRVSLVFPLIWSCYIDIWGKKKHNTWSYNLIRFHRLCCVRHWHSQCYNTNSLADFFPICFPSQGIIQINLMWRHLQEKQKSLLSSPCGCFCWVKPGFCLISPPKVGREWICIFVLAFHAYSTVRSMND